MKNIIEKWLVAMQDQPVLIFSLLFGLVALGGSIAYNSEIEAFPDLTNVQVQVITQYPGKAAEEVERLVTIPLEIRTNGLPGLINQRSISIFGLSMITLTFDDNVVSRQARLDVSQRLSDVELPPEAKPGLSPDSTPVGEIYRFVLEGDLPPDELRLIEDWTVERALRSITGVADVISFGGPVKTIDVKVDPAKLSSLGLNFETIATSIAQNHANAGGGIITHGEESYLVRSIGLIENPEKIESSVVSSTKSTPIRIRDIGLVKAGHRLRLGQVGFNTKNDIVEGIVLLRQGADTLGTCEKVRQTIEHLNDHVLPKGVKLKTIYDRTNLIKKSGHTVVHNIVFGVLLVVVLLIIGLGYRYWMMTLGVALVIPFALICAFVGVNALGYKPNLISLGAVDFGIIVETAIFAAEAVIMSLAVKDKKKKPLSEVLSDVLVPSLICALLLIIAFVPILSLQRVEGRIFRPLGITLVSALIGGQIGAFIFIPLFARMCPQNHPQDDWIEKHFHSVAEKFHHWGSKLTQLKRLPWILGAGFLIVIAGLYLSLGREFLPQLNEGSLYIRSTAPTTISRDEAARLAERVRTLLLEIPEVKFVISQIGRPDDGTDVNGFNNVESLVILADQDEWKSASTLNGLTEFAQKKLSVIDGVDFNFSQPIKDNVDEAISGVKGELVIKVFGNNIDTLQGLADQMKAILNSIPGAQDVGAEELKGQPELRFTMDHEKIARYSVRVADAESALEGALNGKTAAKMTDDQGRMIDIVVKANLQERVDKSTLESLTVISAEGVKVPLGQIASPQLVEGVSRIYREVGERRIAVKCSVRGRAVVDFVQEASRQINEKVKLPDHFRMQWSGSFENANRASKQLGMVVPICIVVMIIILYSWLKSWALVAYTLWEVPFSVVGSLLFLKIFGLNLSISAAAGIIVVVGVSFLTGIMLLLEVVKAQDPWKGLHEKVRSIFISSGVAIIGLIPASFSNGIGSETAKPFAVSILGGLITALIFTVLVLPALIDYFKKESR